MKKSVFAILLILSLQTNAQRMFVTTFYGASGYKGDLQPNTLSFLQAKPVAGLGFDYEITDRIFAKLECNIARVSGDDKYNPRNRARNLSFQSDIYEISLMAEYNLFDLYDYDMTPFFFSGIAYFKFSPFVDLSNGSRAYLKEYSTEGQGFYQGRTPYKLDEWSIPYGFGVQWAITKNIRFAAIMGIRKTNTDYLDDVSTTYVDENLLLQNRGSSAVDLAYKGDLLPYGSPYPAAGTERGNPNDDDVYYFTGASLRFRVDAKGRKRKTETRPMKASVDCPKL